MALQAIRGEVVAADAFSASFYAHITADSKRSRKEAAPANDENADAANANTYTPHTPGKVRGRCATHDVDRPRPSVF